MVLPGAIDCYTYGGIVYEKYIEVSATNTFSHEKPKLVYEQIQQTTSNHAAAPSVRDAIVMQQTLSSTANYVRDQLSIFSELGRDRAFMPKRISKPNEYWQAFLIDGADEAIGILPALQLYKSCQELYQQILDSIPLDNELVQQAILGLNHIQFHPQTLRQRQLELQPCQNVLSALLEVDGPGIIQAFQDIARDDPELLPHHIINLLGIKQESLQAQPEAKEAHTPPKARPSPEVLAQVASFNLDPKIAEQVVRSLQGQLFRKDDKVIRVKDFLNPRDPRNPSHYRKGERGVLFEYCNPVTGASLPRQTHSMYPMKIVEAIFIDETWKPYDI